MSTPPKKRPLNVAVPIPLSEHVSCFNLLLQDTSWAQKVVNQLLLAGGVELRSARLGFVRSLFALVEGFTWIIKQTTALEILNSPKLRTARFWSYLAPLSDQSYQITGDGDFLPQKLNISLQNNLKFALRTFTEAYHIPFNPAILTKQSPQWAAFERCIKIRDRIVHPKNAAAMDISADEQASLELVKVWFGELFGIYVKTIERHVTPEER